MTNEPTVRRDRKVRLNYQLIRNVTAPEEKESGIATYFANLPAFELRHVDTEDNLRNYIPAHPGTGEINERKRNSVHRAIAATMDTEADRFINRNGGITITCSGVQIDEKAYVVELSNPSIINGAQTQGEVMRFMRSMMGEDQQIPLSPFHVRAEINVDPDHGSVVETAIARNSASPVKSISQAGGRGHLDELSEVIRKCTGRDIKKSETAPVENIDTFLVLQAVRLLMPVSVSENETASETLRPYKNKAQCLEDFSSWYVNRSSDPAAAARYKFVIDMACTAIKEYERWQAGGLWTGKYVREETKTGGRSFRRQKGNVIWAAPGIVFPILSALKYFVSQDEGGVWRLEKPPIFDEHEMIDAAIEQWRGHNNDPMAMGRSINAYTALGFMTRMAQRASDRIAAS